VYRLQLLKFRQQLPRLRAVVSLALKPCNCRPLVFEYDFSPRNVPLGLRKMALKHGAVRHGSMLTRTKMARNDASAAGR
jgi:hypothetical protein